MPRPHRPAAVLSRRDALAGAALAGAFAVLPAAARGQGRTASRTETVTTPDGWTLPVSLTLPGGAGEDTPAVVLIHGEKESRKNWESFANFLAGRGYAVLAPDLRHHGEAANPAARSTGRVTSQDYRAMAGLDMEAVKALLLDLHARKTLNVRKLGVVAAEEGAPVALAFAYNDWRKQPLPDAPVLANRTPTGQDVRAVVLLSPVDAVPGLNAAAVARPISEDALDVGFLTVVGDRDTDDDGDAEKLHNRFGGRRDDRAERVAKAELPGIPLRGTRLLQDPVGEGVRNGVVQFLDRWVKDRPDPWRSRAGQL